MSGGVGGWGAGTSNGMFAGRGTGFQYGGGGSIPGGGMPGVTYGGGYNGGPTPPPPQWTPPPVPDPPAAVGPFEFRADVDPALKALADRYGGYLDNLEGNTGRIQDITAGRLRDAREGGRKALQTSAAMRGVSDESAATLTGSYDAETARGEQGAIADVATDRERTYGQALQAGVGVVGAPGARQLDEKQLGYQAWQGANAVNASTTQAYLALLASRNAYAPAPIQYAGYR